MELRVAHRNDADPLTSLFLSSRQAAMPWLAVIHSDEETKWWIKNVVLRELDVHVATDNHVITGFIATKPGWIEHLYVHPHSQGQGVGTALLMEAQRQSELRLRVFERNTSARKFYEKRGFVEEDRNDGSRNEEHEPDMTYVWRRPRGTVFR